MVCLGACRYITGCGFADEGISGVAPFRLEEIKENILIARQAHPNTIMLFFVNWNYDMEVYPQPTENLAIGW